jgi:hypothetical protein
MGTILPIITENNPNLTYLEFSDSPREFPVQQLIDYFAQNSTQITHFEFTGQSWWKPSDLLTIFAITTQLTHLKISNYMNVSCVDFVENLLTLCTTLKRLVLYKCWSFAQNTVVKCIPLFPKCVVVVEFGDEVPEL